MATMKGLSKLLFDINNYKEDGRNEIAFTQLPIPKAKPALFEVLIDQPMSGFRVLVNGVNLGKDSSEWYYIADGDGVTVKEFSNFKGAKRYLQFLKSKGYDLRHVRLVKEYHFNVGGDF